MQLRTSWVATTGCLVLLLSLAAILNNTVPLYNLVDQDIYYSYVEGTRIVDRVNPYGRIATGDMRTNDKYATYFPLFYEASYLSILLGLKDYPTWIGFWRQVFNAFEYSIALLFLTAFARKGSAWVGLAAAVFWLFNRWTLYIVTTANLDFIPIFLLLAAVLFYSRNKTTALLLLSVSLALKQIGILAAPLFVIWVYQEAKSRREGLLNAAKASALIASVPLLTSIPFLVWNPVGFLRSMVFALTRLPGTHLQLPSFEQLMGWEGIVTRLPMFLLWMAIYAMAARGIGGRHLPLVLLFGVFLSFNAILFNQYFVWLFAFFPLLLMDLTPMPGWVKTEPLK
jgi:uncharacterized membrane protein